MTFRGYRLPHPSFLFLCSSFIFALALSASVTAQTTGTIAGRITDEKSGLPLPGATVRVDGTRLGAVSDRAGEYRIDNVPAGPQKLIVTYIGYTENTRQVTVEAGKDVTVHFLLVDKSVETEGVVIWGARQGQARALNQQKTADNIVNVVAADQIGRFPDPNTAEAVQRIPGVSIQRDQGEGRYVQIRGTSPRLTSVTINGEQVPSPEGDIRYVALDVIPADQLASIEVNKALTPNLDADGIGGSINLVTRGTYSTEPVAKATIAGGYNNLVSDMNYQIAGTYGQRVGEEGRFGYIFSGSYYRTNRGSDNNEFEWGDEEVGDAEPIVLQNLEFRDYVITRDRLGLSGKVDYNFSDRSSAFVQGIYNRFGDQENRRRLRLRYDKGDYESETQVTDADVERELKDRYEVQDIYSVRLGGEFPLIGDAHATIGGSYSYAQEEEPERRDITFAQGGVDMSYNPADPNFPVFSINNDADIYNSSAYEFEDLVVENNLTTDQNLSATLDFTVPFSLGSFPTELQLGGKFRNKKKDRTNDVRIYDEFNGELTLDQVVGDFEPEDFLEGRYTLGRSPDPDKVKELFENNTSSFVRNEEDSHIDTDPANYEATENIIGAYAMARVNFGQLSTLLGARMEMTDIDYTGNRLTLDEEGNYVGTSPVSGTNDYASLFPMIHLRYAFGENTNVRAAWTNSLARPNYYDLVPYQIINREDEELGTGNPLLEPTTAMNIDLLGEHYFQSIGIISAGVFYKTLTDYIYTSVYEQSGGDFDGYEVVQPVNGADATLLGFELNWQQQLSFLPGFLSGFGVYANYTYTSSDAEIPGRTEKVNLPGQSEHVANTALSYEKYDFTARLSVNLHGSYLDQVGDTPETDIYYDSHTQLDLSLGYRIMPNLSIFAELINLTDAPLRYFQNETADRPIVQEYYSWWSHVGVKFDL